MARTAQAPAVGSDTILRIVSSPMHMSIDSKILRPALAELVAVGGCHVE